jgi:stage V sporulation protein R
MELIDQHTKDIMEGCKRRAKDAGLSFQEETLEYIVTNRDLLELSPRMMIPTLYDYWVHDVEVLKEKGKYELYPGNPYETVINTRPAISFYNDNNPDWLNVMIFYHVLAHIDFFQNNVFFRHTWDYDFSGQALSDKRVIARLRAEKGRWLDYVIEFARGIDNLVGYFDELSALDRPSHHRFSARLDFYFDIFLQSIKKVKIGDYISEVELYNDTLKAFGQSGEDTFFGEVRKKYPEFEALYTKSVEKKSDEWVDLLQFLENHSEFLQKEENQWMKSVLQVVRKTSLFFQPQIRTKIMNEGWASFWHENLFLKDDRIKSHEVDFARVNAGVTAMPRVGLNPYALGMRLYDYIETLVNQGKREFEFQRILDARQRKAYDKHTGQGRAYIFEVRRNLCDFMFINNFVDQDFVDQNELFVAGKRLNQSKMVWEYYVKSRKAEDYRAMLQDALYHPPTITVDKEKTTGNTLYLVHRFEHKPLVKEFIHNTMLGIEYLWGGPVKLETSEVVAVPATAYASVAQSAGAPAEEPAREITWHRVLYTMENRKLDRKIIWKPT